ncbi:MAG: phosphoribosyltransferase [Ignavibacteria bacterium]|nr:phosphoribosyltransferase [Ignavibacteria bacterium]
MKTLSSILKATTTSITDLLARRICLVCKSVLNNNPVQKSVSYITSGFICPRCNDRFPAPIEPSGILNQMISHFPGDELSISNAACLFQADEDSAYMELIYALKYKGFKRVGEQLGTMLGDYLNLIGMTDFDFITAVPIHSARRRERGYNQSEYIARAVADNLNKPANFKLIKRNKYTQTQTLLGSDERRKNVNGVFAGGKEFDLLRNKKILLIDDVLTTGATINAAATALLESGAKRVDCAALAHA